MFKDVYKYDSVIVAMYIAAYANMHHYSINITKIQKLLYVTYGAYLVLHNSRLCNEHAQAWPYGPVFPKTRTALLKCSIESIEFSNKLLQKIENKEILENIVAFTFVGFGDKTAGQLTDWSHRAGSPWFYATQQSNFQWGDEIPDIFIYDYFNARIKRNE